MHLRKGGEAVPLRKGGEAVPLRKVGLRYLFQRLSVRGFGIARPFSRWVVVPLMLVCRLR